MFEFFKTKSIYLFVLGVLGIVAAYSSFAAEMERSFSLKSYAEINGEKICLQDISHDLWIKNKCTNNESCCQWDLGDKNRTILTRADVEKGLKKVKFDNLNATLSESTINEV